MDNDNRKNDFVRNLTEELEGALDDIVASGTEPDDVILEIDPRDMSFRLVCSDGARYEDCDQYPLMDLIVFSEDGKTVADVVALHEIASYYIN